MRFGFPQRITSDNGQQLTSTKFKNFFTHRGIEHILSPPYWPKANGLVEHLNRSFQAAVEAARVEDRSWNAALEPFLFAYRNMPHPATNLSLRQRQNACLTLTITRRSREFTKVFKN